MTGPLKRCTSGETSFFRYSYIRTKSLLPFLKWGLSYNSSKLSKYQKMFFVELLLIAMYYFRSCLPKSAIFSKVQISRSAPF